MGAAFKTIKWLVFILNIVCLFLGVGQICVNAMGVEESEPETDAHTFFILAILTCCLLCLTTVIGCYGVCSEVFGINVIYCIFILALLSIQYLQMRSFQPPEFYFNNLKDLESAWSLVDSQPKYMDAIQTKLHCCGLFNSHDYAFKRLSIPDSCYTSNTEAEAEAKNLVASIHQLNNIGCLETVWYHNKFIVHRHVAFNWTLLITELVTFIYAIILSILIFKRRQRSRSETLHHTVVVRNYAHQINSSSRQLLLSH